MYICVVLSQARSETSLRHEDASRSLRLKSDDRGAGTGAKRLLLHVRACFSLCMCTWYAEWRYRNIYLLKTENLWLHTFLFLPRWHSLPATGDTVKTLQNVPVTSFHSSKLCPTFFTHTNIDPDLSDFSFVEQWKLCKTMYNLPLTRIWFKPTDYIKH